MRLEVTAMNRSICLSLGVLSLSALLACDNDETAAGGAGEGAGAQGGNAAQGGSGGGASNLEWQTLMTAEWQLGPGEELTSDEHTFVLDRDMYVGGIRP